MYAYTYSFAATQRMIHQQNTSHEEEKNARQILIQYRLRAGHGLEACCHIDIILRIWDLEVLNLE